MEKDVKKKDIQHHIAAATDRVPECLNGKYIPKGGVEKINEREDRLSHARCNIKIKFPVQRPGNDN